MLTRRTSWVLRKPEKPPKTPRYLSIKLAYTLGPQFSYSEIATRKYLEESGVNAEIITLKPLNRSEGVIEELVRTHEQGMRDVIAVVPIYNTNEGRVKDTLAPGRGLLKYPVQIHDEYIMKISHCLAAKKKNAKIRLVISHPQALQQCISYIRSLGAKHADSFDGQAVTSTAHSARIVAESSRDDVAAVCSEEAARNFKLEIANEGQDIQDKLFAGYENRTVFIILRMERNGQSPTGKDKTTMTFSLRRPDKPGSMRDMFEIFADANINVSHHEAMEKGSLLDYVFWFNVDEHRDKMRQTLAALQDLSINLNLHGSYPRKTP